MRQTLLPLVVLSLLLTARPATAGAAAAAADDGTLVVHEWGTFTSFAGADGVYVDYRTRVGGDLPAFVLTRQRQAAASIARPAPPPRPSANPFLKEELPTLSRMETPVTYFYSDRPMAVQAHVEFPRGLFTEFYPPVKAMAPIVTADEQAGTSTPPVANGMLDWGTIQITPPAAADRSKVPTITDGDRYAAARATDADIVQTVDPQTHAVQQEHFLFYRGICNLDLPLFMQSLGDGRFELMTMPNASASVAFLVQVDRGVVRFARFINLSGHRVLSLPNETSTLDALADAMTRDLAAAGLYDKEARAMVATWRSSWFGEDGTRLLYLLPQTFTDAALPLQITPTPRETIRVMVGRLEAMTPERERQITASLARLAGEHPGETPFADEVRQLGRFAEPALHRIAVSTHDPLVKGEAEAILKSLKH